MTNPQQQYQDNADLRTRQETHRLYTVGRPLEAMVDEALRLESYEALLDVGTATGDFLGRLRLEGHTGRLVGLDFSSGMIEKARASQAGVEFVQGDAMALPFDDSSFDLVTARHMLYHVPDIRSALLEARRVLRPDGRFLAVTNADGYFAEYWNLARDALVGVSAFDAFIAEMTSPRYFHGELETLIREVFGHARLEVKDQHLEFPDVAPVLAYWDSAQNGSGVSSADWAVGRERFAQALEPKFASGPWRVWKGVAFIQATRADA
jgi:SAM-dependent methyltransferase